MVRHLEYPDVPFHELLSNSAERWPDRVAIRFRDRRITFAELNRQANSVAVGLVAAGVGRGERVGLFMPNCPEYEAIFFGVARAGAAATPLNPAYREREAQYQLQESGASCLFVHHTLWSVIDAIRQELPDVRLIVMVGDGAAPAGTVAIAEFTTSGESAPAVQIAPDDLAALPFSSGTTGRSKGVMLAQRNLVCNAYQFIDATHTTPADVILIFLPLYHIYGVGLMANSLAGGATQVLMERFDLAEMLRLIAAERVTEIFAVPPVVLALVKTAELDVAAFDTVRFFMCAAAPLAPELGRQLNARLGNRVTQAYGMTESSPLTHMLPLAEAEAFGDSVGVPAADTRCRIVDLETGTRDLAPGETGEVIVAGPQVMLGYWNAPEETARALRDGWLHTGDVGYATADDHLYIVDRMKEMIKFKAFSIAPAELEALLLEHPAVQDCAVVGSPDAEAGEVPRAFVVRRPDAEVSADELAEFVRERVASYKQVRYIEFVEAIPRTTSGKILRRVLRDGAASA